MVFITGIYICWKCPAVFNELSQHVCELNNLPWLHTLTWVRRVAAVENADRLTLCRIQNLPSHCSGHWFLLHSVIICFYLSTQVRACHIKIFDANPAKTDLLASFNLLFFSVFTCSKKLHYFPAIFSSSDTLMCSPVLLCCATGFTAG